MNTAITMIAGLFLMLGGLSVFPLVLSYANTSWMPRWMRPDVDYLERLFRYDYPARGIHLLFSIQTMFVGAMSLASLYAKDLFQTVTPVRWILPT